MLGRSVKPVVPSTSRVNPDLDLDRNFALARALDLGDIVAAAPITGFF